MNIEEMLSEIIDRVTRIEERLNDRYRFKVDETSINNYLNQVQIVLSFQNIQLQNQIFSCIQ